MRDAQFPMMMHHMTEQHGRTIVLMRHGIPSVDGRQKVSPAGLREWLELYDRAPIAMPGGASARFGAYPYVICSVQQRARSTAKILNLDVAEYSELFREAALPLPQWNWPKLRAEWWTTILRYIWFVGLSMGAESYPEALSRSHAASRKLMALAGKKTNILVIGHGLFNELVFDRLVESGWMPAGNYHDGYGFGNILTTSLKNIQTVDDTRQFG